MSSAYEKAVMDSHSQERFEKTTLQASASMKAKMQNHYVHATMMTRRRSSQ